MEQAKNKGKNERNMPISTSNLFGDVGTYF